MKVLCSVPAGCEAGGLFHCSVSAKENKENIRGRRRRKHRFCMDGTLFMGLGYKV